MNSMALTVLRPPEGPDGRAVPFTMEGLRAHFALRMGELPSLRWRLQDVPLGLHHPVYLEDPEFDLDYHLRHVVLPAPGTPDQLDLLFARLGEVTFDRRHALWRGTLVDGLHDGRQAFILQIHHSLIDGVAAMTTLTRILSGVDHEPIAPAEPWRTDRVPRKSRLVAGALVDHARNVPAVPPLVRRTIRGVKAFRQRWRDPDVAVRVPRPVIDTPPCQLNDAFTNPRAYARVQLPLVDVKLVKDVAGVSINDVVLAIAAGGLRRYLERRGDLPDAPLVANVPVSLEPPGAPVRQHGNRFAATSTSLATDVTDPWERIQVIHDVTNEAKLLLDLIDPALLPDWVELFPPCLARPIVQFHQRHRARHRDRADQSINVSNIRGPSKPWMFGPTMIEELYFSGPPAAGVGINMMVFSYGDRLTIGMLSYASALRDPGALVQALEDSLQELVKEAEVHRSPVEVDA